jgi:DNA modification methylase
MHGIASERQRPVPAAREGVGGASGQSSEQEDMKDNWLNRVHVGDCREVMRRMIAEGIKVQTVVTSPPYWGLRDYGVKGQIGLERNPVRYLARMRGVFRLLWDVLADDGTVWLNMGDCYYTPRVCGGIGYNSTINGQGSQAAFRDAQRAMKSGGKNHSNMKAETLSGPHRQRSKSPMFMGLKEKDMVGMPWLLALALRADGWYLRRDIIWHKLNPMPESVDDRPTTAHEYLFLLSKQQRYYYDAEAIKEPASDGTHPRIGVAPGQPRSRPQGVNPKAAMSHKPVAGWDKGPGSHDTLEHATKAGKAEDNGARTRDGTKFGRGPGWRKQNESFAAATAGEVVTMRNKRSVWSVPTQPYSEAHFATYPEELIAPCILAGCPAGGIVFDPFYGSGTTGEVATDLGRHFIAVELNPDYAKMDRSLTTTIGMPL